MAGQLPAPTSQNFVTVTRAWSKTLGAQAAGATAPVTSDVAFQYGHDPLYQLFKQLNAVISDSQNVILSSPSLTAGASTIPTNSAFWVIAGGVYMKAGANLTYPALTGAAVTTGNFGLYWFTIDSAGNPHSYASPTNNSSTRAGLLFPSPLPSASEAIIGMIEVAPTTTFTPGTTNLNASNVNATVFSIIGDTGFTAFGMQEMQVS